MKALSAVRLGLNAMLRPLNVRLDTLTAERLESARLLDASRRGQFDELQFPVRDHFLSTMSEQIVGDVGQYASVFDSWREPSQNSMGFSLANDYFGSPDAEVLYAMLRRLRPRRVIEIGSGNSTRVMRMAIDDGGFQSELISIDPAPRLEIERVADQILRQPVETIPVESIVSQLGAGDVMFVDSSHEIKTGGDVPFIYLKVMPRLRDGVIIHIHDIFYPFDYPREWVIDNGWRWNEQYLVSAMMIYDPGIELLWAGHHLKKTKPDLLPQFSQGRASSLWIRKRSGQLR
jgi:predicted O-methyltransferase YrrM